MKKKFLESLCIGKFTKPWIYLMLITAGIVLWLGGVFSYKLYPYLALNKVAEASIKAFEIREVKGEKYAISANYSYSVRDTTYEKQYTFVQPLFLNAFAARDHLKHWDMSKMQVWYQDSNPDNGSLQKLFPFKAMIHLGLSLGVLMYFIWFRGYLSQLN